jgi:hypothetical protein
MVRVLSPTTVSITSRVAVSRSGLGLRFCAQARAASRSSLGMPALRQRHAVVRSTWRALANWVSVIPRTRLQRCRGSNSLADLLVRSPDKPIYRGRWRLCGFAFHFELSTDRVAWRIILRGPASATLPFGPESSGQKLPLVYLSPNSATGFMHPHPSRIRTYFW